MNRGIFVLDPIPKYLSRKREEKDMRGNIELFTLSIDLKQAYRFEVARSEKVDHSIPARISMPLDQATRA
jgi:hypothetical protein